MILEWSKNNNSSVESVDAVVSEKIGEIYQQQIPNAGDPTGSHGLYRKSKLFSQNGFGFLFCCYISVTNRERCGTFISILEGSLKSQAVSFAIPVAAVLPWSDSVLQEYKSGFLKEILPRTTRRQYIEGKVFSIMVSGFMVWTLSILTVLFINFIVFYPLEIKGAIQKEALLDLLMKAFRTGLIGSIISTFGGSCGILWDSAYMAYGIPFVSFYFGIILHDRYFKNQIWFYPVEWILADENWGPDKIGVWLFLLLFLLVMLGILGGVLYGRLEEI